MRSSSYSLKDIDGNELHLGDRVFVYALQHAEIDRVNMGDGMSLITYDTSQPLPMVDVPLFSGTIGWSPDLLQLVVLNRREHGTSFKVTTVDGECKEASVVVMDPLHYAYQLMPETPPLYLE